MLLSGDPDIALSVWTDCTSLLQLTESDECINMSKDDKFNRLSR